jgi:hypothetical protein
MLIIVFCNSSFARKSPTDKGSIIVDGSFAFSTAGGDLYETNGNKRTSISFVPSISCFMIPGFAFGGEGWLVGNFQEDSRWISWSFGPRVLYFVGGDKPRATAKGSTYAYLDVAFLHTKTTTEYTIRTTQGLSAEMETNKSTTSGDKITLGLGICYMLSDVVGITVKAEGSIEGSKPKDGDSVSGNEFSILGGTIAFLY